MFSETQDPSVWIQHTYKLDRTHLGQQHKQKRARTPAKLSDASVQVPKNTDCLEAWLHAHSNHWSPFEMGGADPDVVSPARDIAS